MKPIAALSVTLSAPGGPDVLRVEEHFLPSPGPGQVRISTEAAGVAFNDITTRQGLNPGRLPRVLGFDAVGHIDAVGPGVGDLAIGQRVGALVGTGGYATHVLAPQGRVAPLPEGPDAAVLDALMLNYLTAWQMFQRVARPQPGQSVLVLGAAGGVGSALCQLAAHAGVIVHGTSSPSRRAQVEALGATWAPNAAAVPAPVAATFDPVGGPSLAQSRRATAGTGVVVSYGFSFAAGSGHSRTGALLRTAAAIARAKLTPGPRLALHTVERAVDRDTAAFRADITTLTELLAQEAIAPKVTTLRLQDAAEAHRRLENREVTGKLVLLP
ncbi:zinc-binding dehydrogenase [Streptomyces sp. 8P21H-1]|uniref:alcohol dehydrogenase catalytic domain-containing protein n=1 Tax=Streptomyces sp. 8P21H-1 TaxID=2737048 RepID=UPI0015701F55|nr:zinc-binding dehydrogenase [Streptomyces sp. 8P21H-1]NSL43344.1 zinc-binding dehydrogenase [Streptomyces sp. 8P21H-1]